VEFREQLPPFLLREINVDIGTEWNLEVIGSMSYPVEASVDIGTEWNLEDIVPERIVITGWSRYRNRVEFRDYRISF